MPFFVKGTSAVPATLYNLDIGGSPTQLADGTSYTVSLNDYGKTLIINGSGLTIDIVLPTNIPAGFYFRFQNIGLPTANFIKSGSDTLYGNTIAMYQSGGTITKISSTQWTVFGGTAEITEYIECARIPLVPSNNISYKIITRLPYEITVLSVSQTADSFSVAGTYDVLNNGAFIGGLTNVPNVSGALNSTNATSDNIVQVGDELTVVMSNMNSPVDYVMSVFYTRYL